ncbi:MAG TPA: amino acid permease, partial [Candidatus Thermoplasmatota archaeon]|nr:amino acid permease [Candidatus Thermoplasmatota archaeon]
MAQKRRVAVRAEVAPEPPVEPKRKRARAVVAPEPESGPQPATPPTPLEPKPNPFEPYRRLLIKKPVDELVEEGSKRSQLRRTLGPTTLTLLGLGGIIGTGIFVLTGVAAKDYSGNMIWLSFVVAGFVATLAAFSYAELASMIPVSGSAYTYAYAGVGETIAWVIGWDLVLEYAVGAMTVAQGWAGYTTGLLAQGGVEIPYEWSHGPLQGGYINVLAVLIVLAITALLVYGIQESANVTNVLVVVKVGIIVFVILLGFLVVQGVEGSGSAGFYLEGHATQGLGGMVTAAGLVFFAYIGF